MYVQIQSHTHTHFHTTHTHTHIHTFTHTHTFMHTHTHARMHTHTCAHAHTCVYNSNSIVILACAFSTGPTAAPQNVTVKRFSDAMLVSWNELSIVQSRGFPIYTVQYQSTDAGSPLHINDISENYVIIENLLPNNDYLVSVAAAVREGQEVLTGPSSESVEVIAISFSSKL